MSDQGLDSLPRPVPEILLEIIQAGLLNIRSAAWADDSRRCAMEADHIHNLPGLIREFREEGLRYYLEVERSDFIRGSTSTAIFTELWRELDASSGLTLED